MWLNSSSSFPTGKNSNKINSLLRSSSLPFSRESSKHAWNRRRCQSDLTLQTATTTATSTSIGTIRRPPQQVEANSEKKPGTPKLVCQRKSASLFAVTATSRTKEMLERRRSSIEEKQSNSDNTNSDCNQNDDNHNSKSSCWSFDPCSSALDDENDGENNDDVEHGNATRSSETVQNCGYNNADDDDSSCSSFFHGGSDDFVDHVFSSEVVEEKSPKRRLLVPWMVRSSKKQQQATVPSKTSITPKNGSATAPAGDVPMMINMKDNNDEDEGSLNDDLDNLKQTEDGEETTKAGKNQHLLEAPHDARYCDKQSPTKNKKRNKKKKKSSDDYYRERQQVWKEERSCRRAPHRCGSAQWHLDHPSPCASSCRVKREPPLYGDCTNSGGFTDQDLDLRSRYGANNNNCSEVQHQPRKPFAPSSRRLAVSQVSPAGVPGPRQQQQQQQQQSSLMLSPIEEVRRGGGGGGGGRRRCH